jgi:hypothetical protein
VDSLARGARDSFFSGTYKWFYYSERQSSYDAQFVLLLRETKWLPGPGGLLKRPGKICFSELPSALFEASDYLQRKARRLVILSKGLSTMGVVTR